MANQTCNHATRSSETITERQREAMRRSYVGEDAHANTVYWPTGHDVLVLRALAREGLLSETTGACEGCASHSYGHPVPVFVEKAP